MAKHKPIQTRIAKLGLFLLVTFIVFNFSGFVQMMMIEFGFKELNWVQVKEININDDLEQNLNSRAIIYTYNGNLMVSISNKLNLYNDLGDLINKKAINSDSRKIVGMENYFLVADVIQGNITILDYLGKTVGEVRTIGRIEDIVYVSDDIFAVVKADDRLQIYNFEGVLESEVKLSTGQLLSIDVSKDNETILVNVLNTDEEQFNSQLLTYSMRSKLLVGAHNNYEKIILGARMFSNDIILVDDVGQHAYRLGDSEHYVWNHQREGKLVNFKIDTNGNVYEIISDDIVDYTGQSTYYLTGLNKDGNELFNVELNSLFNNINLHQGKLLLSDDKKIAIYQSDGVLLTEHESTKKIYSCKWLTANRLVVEYNDYAEIIELTY